LDNRDGRLELNHLVLAQLAALENRNGQILHTGREASTLTISGTFDNSQGRLQSAAEALSLHAGRWINTQGLLSHSGDAGLAVAVTQWEGVAGTVVTPGTLTVKADQVHHQQAALSAGQLLLSARHVDNRPTAAPAAILSWATAWTTAPVACWQAQAGSR